MTFPDFFSSQNEKGKQIESKLHKLYLVQVNNFQRAPFFLILFWKIGMIFLYRSLRHRYWHAEFPFKYTKATLWKSFTCTNTVLVTKSHFHGLKHLFRSSFTYLCCNCGFFLLGRCTWQISFPLPLNKQNYVRKLNYVSMLLYGRVKRQSGTIYLSLFDINCISLH